MKSAPKCRKSVVSGPATVVLLALAATSCTTETIVFRDREPFNIPLPAAAGMLGYFDAGAKQTSCGNCHVGVQAQWISTAHASAVETLAGSAGAQEFCYGCHTVNEAGNRLEEPAGYAAVADTSVRPVYHDVQCESCHGPGLDHVLNPDVDANKPIPSILADTGLTNGCGECHEGSHHPFVEQWKASRHGTPIALSFAGTRETCAPCHEGNAALRVKFGENATYLERDDPTPLPITCAVCHDPHGSPNGAQLRAPIDVATADNLCVTCHSRKGTPPSARGPHAAQGLMVLGENVGWIPPGFQYDTTSIISSHGSEANRRLCATCHVSRLTVTDAITGDFQFQSVGHLFEAVTCLDANGEPTTGPCPDSQRDFSSCSTSGCHGSAAVARTALQTIRSRMEFLVDQLWTDTNGDDSINAGDAGLLPQVVALGDTAELNVSDGIVTVAEGALWNAQLAYPSTRTNFSRGYAFGIEFSAHKTSGEGVHNPFLLEALLIASINAVTAEYNLTPREGDLRILATPPPAVRLR